MHNLTAFVSKPLLNWQSPATLATLNNSSHGKHILKQREASLFAGLSYYVCVGHACEVPETHCVG